MSSYLPSFFITFCSSFFCAIAGASSQKKTEKEPPSQSLKKKEHTDQKKQKKEKKKTSRFNSIYTKGGGIVVGGIFAVLGFKRYPKTDGGAALDEQGRKAEKKAAKEKKLLVARARKSSTELGERKDIEGEQGKILLPAPKDDREHTHNFLGRRKGGCLYIVENDHVYCWRCHLENPLDEFRSVGTSYSMKLCSGETQKGTPLLGFGFLDHGKLVTLQRDGKLRLRVFKGFRKSYVLKDEKDLALSKRSKNLNISLSVARSGLILVRIAHHVRSYYVVEDKIIPTKLHLDYGTGAAAADDLGKWMAYTKANDLSIIEVASGNRIQTMEHKEKIVGIAFSMGNQLLALADDHKRVMIYSLDKKKNSYKKIKEFRCSSDVCPDGIAFSGSYLTTLHENGQLEIWDTRDIQRLDENKMASIPVSKNFLGVY